MQRYSITLSIEINTSLMNQISKFFFLVGLTFLSSLSSSQVHDFNRSVRFMISELSDGSNTLSWAQEANATAYSVRRRELGLGNFTVLANLPGDATQYIDTNVQKGLTYEYELRKTISASGTSITSPGYLFGGNEAPPIHFRGYYLILAEKNAFNTLESKLMRLKLDLEMDGWAVIIRTVESNTPVTEVKNTIRQVHEETQGKLSTVFLFGRVPVPYSGNIRPDGHPDHEGAWPADVYYADLDGNWTDININNTVANNTRHHNVPGDGKFDQSFLPSVVDIEIGRVDFFDMPAFSKSEIQLLETYLDKNHEFRNGRINMPRRGIIQNNFSSFEEAFGQTGLNNFTRFFGIDSVRYGEYRNTLRNQPYLWSYGCGPGSYTSAGGITNTANFVVDSLQTVFTVLFGSYFGDWDSRNNLLRAALASGTTLTNVWAGRPHWYFHHMAMGRHIGYSVRLTQNNSFYPTGFGGRMIHIALMGDPGLTMYPFSAIEDVTAVVNAGSVDIQVLSTQFDEYFYYIKKAEDLEYSLINEVPTAEKSLRLDCLGPGDYHVMVRAARLETNASGSFVNLSIGQRVAFTTTETTLPVAEFDFDLDFDLLTAGSNVKNADTSYWRLIGQDVREFYQSDLEILLDTSSTYQLCLIASNSCDEIMICKDLPTVVSSLPDLVNLSITQPSCYGYSDGEIKLELIGGASPFEIVWSDGTEGPVIDQLPAGTYSAIITSRTGRSGDITIILDQPDPLEVDVEIQYITGGSDNIVKLNVTGGSPVYRAIWPDGYEGLSRENVSVGDYTVEIVDAKGCIVSTMFSITPSSISESDNSRLVYYAILVSEDALVISFNDLTPYPYRARLYTIDGKMLISELIPKNTKGWQMNCSNLVSGLYILDIEYDGRHNSSKIIKY